MTNKDDFRKRAEECRYSLKNEQKERRKKGLCHAYIIHGPGHQSKTFCQLKGKHRKHFAIYGRFELSREWRNIRGSSGMDDQ